MSKNSRLSLRGIGLVLTLAMLLRLPLLNGSFWLDEAAQALESVRPLSQQLDIVADFQPPLLHLVTHFQFTLGQQLGICTFDRCAEWWLRLAGALIPGLVTIYVTFLIGKKLGGPKVGLLAGLLLATNSLHIFYSQELRPYSLPTMWVVVSWWALLDQRTLWLLVSTALGFYSSFLYPFAWLGQLAYQLVVVSMARKKSNPDKPPKILIFNLLRQTWALWLGALSFGLWLPVLRQQLAAGAQVRALLPTWETAVSIPQLKALPLVAAKFIYGVIPIDLNLQFGVPLLIVALLMGYLLYQHWSDQHSKLNPQSLLPIFWLILPLLTAWLLSFYLPVIRPKRFLYLLPGFYLTTAWLTLKLKLTPQRSNWLQSFLILGLLTLNLWGSWQYFTQPNIQRENWRTLISQIQTQYSQGSAAVFAFAGPVAPWAWYAQSSYPVISSNQLNIPDIQSAQNIVSNSTQFEHLLYFDYLSDLTDPDRYLIQAIEAVGFDQKDLIEYPGIGYVREYRKININ